MLKATENLLSHLLDFREAFREQGVWWLPDKPNDQVAGTLTFDQDEGALLALVGVLGTMRDALAFAFDRGQVPAIHGLTMKGKRITLLKSFRKTSNFNFPGIANEVYFSNVVLVGCHASSADDRAYASSDFRFDEIEQWLGHRRFRPTGGNGGEFPYRMERLEKRVLASIGDFTLTTDAIATFNAEDGAELSAKSESLVIIGAIEPQSLSWHLSVATKLQSLASLCAGKHLPLSALRLKGAAERVTEDHAENPDIEVLVSMIGGNARSAKKGDPYVFTADTLLSHSAEAIGQWYSAYERIAPALNLYFATIGYNHTYSNVRFVLAVQALEVYHRRTSSAGLIDGEEYAKLVAALTAAIPAHVDNGMREKLSRTLEFANEPTLGQRVKDIVKPLRSAFGKNPVGMSKSYVSRIVATRNYNTHYSDESKDRAFNGADLHWATRRIVTLLTIVFLRHIGVPADTLREAMKKNREFELLLASEGVPAL